MDIILMNQLLEVKYHRVQFLEKLMQILTSFADNTQISTLWSLIGDDKLTLRKTLVIPRTGSKIRQHGRS